VSDGVERKKIRLSNQTVTVTALALLVAIMLPVVSAETLTPEHVARIRTVGEATVSPDGNLIAYVLNVPRNPFEEDNGSSWKQLHVVDRDGNSRPFVTGKMKISSITFTPGGDFISFLAEKGDDTIKSLYRIPVVGGESQKVVDFCSSMKSYSWSPDDHRVAFLAREARGEESVELRKKGFDQEIYEEDWRPVKVWMFDVDNPSVKPTMPAGSSTIWSMPSITW
jgi:dipeptidyl aminopeptidase/acylaminoacyl peptidase